MRRIGIEQSKTNPDKSANISCQFCSNRMSQFPMSMSKKNQDPSTSISNLHETFNSKQSTSQAIEKQQQQFKSSVSHNQQHNNHYSNEQKSLQRDQIFQLNICFNCLNRLRRLNASFQKTQEYIGKENELKLQSPDKNFLKNQNDSQNNQNSDQGNFEMEKSIGENSIQSKEALKKISEESNGSNVLSDLILQDHKFFKNHKTNSVKNEESLKSQASQSGFCLGLNSYQNQPSQVGQTKQVDCGLLGMNSIIQEPPSKVSTFQPLKMHLDKKIILEGFPRENIKFKKVNNCSIETLVEKEKIQIEQDEKSTTACFICNYEIQDINSFSVETTKNTRQKEKKICRLCHTLNEAQNPLISFQGRNRIKTTQAQYSRSKRPETLAKLPTYLRDRIATTNNRFQQASKEKRQSHSRKRMVPRQKLNKKNTSKKTGCELCFKIGLTLIKKGDQNLCVNCYYMNRNVT